MGLMVFAVEAHIPSAFAFTARYRTDAGSLTIDLPSKHTGLWLVGEHLTDRVRL
jgi:hypothetical protein